MNFFVRHICSFRSVHLLASIQPRLFFPVPSPLVSNLSRTLSSTLSPSVKSFELDRFYKSTEEDRKRPLNLCSRSFMTSTVCLNIFEKNWLLNRKKRWFLTPLVISVANKSKKSKKSRKSKKSKKSKKTKKTKMAKWGYTRKDGPHTWANSFPLANGIRQSPINIEPDTTIQDQELAKKPIMVNYDPAHMRTLENTGHGFKISTKPDSQSVIEGGPLTNKYRLEQFHFHWGASNTTGSEHTINGKSFAAEVHLVHWNFEKYENMNVAAENGDGLCVLGTFFKVGKHHPEIQKIIDRFEDIKFKGQKVDFSTPFDCTKLLPATRSYWTYPGSLTTPPLYECVIWVVFKESLEMSAEQLAAFRNLCSYCDGEQCPADEFEGKIAANFRPPLPRGERVVRDARDA